MESQMEPGIPEGLHGCFHRYRGYTVVSIDRGERNINSKVLESVYGNPKKDGPLILGNPQVSSCPSEATVHAANSDGG